MRRYGKSRRRKRAVQWAEDYQQVVPGLIIATGTGLAPTATVHNMIFSGSDQPADAAALELAGGSVRGGIEAQFDRRGFRVERVVGKLHVALQQRPTFSGEPLQAYNVIVMAGVCVVDTADDGSEVPSGVPWSLMRMASSVGEQAAEMASTSHRWLWRREWILQNNWGNGPVYDASGAIPDGLQYNEGDFFGLGYSNPAQASNISGGRLAMGAHANWVFMNAQDNHHMDFKPRVVIGHNQKLVLKMAARDYSGGNSTSFTIAQLCRVRTLVSRASMARRSRQY